MAQIIWDEPKDKIVWDTEQPKAGIVWDKPMSRGEAAEKGFLEGALNLSEGLGSFFSGVMPGQYNQQTAEDTSRTASAQAVAAHQQHPFTTGLAEFAPKLAMAVPGALAGGALASSVGAPIILADIMGGIGAGIPASLQTQATVKNQLLNQGVDRETAEKAAKYAGATEVAAFALPAGIGRTIGGKALTGMGINVAQGETDVAIQNSLLAEKYPHLKQELFNPTRMGINAVLGGVMGPIGGIHPKSYTRAGIQEERAAKAFQKALDNELTLPTGFGKAKAEQAYTFVSRDVDSLGREVAELESKKREVDLAGTPEEKIVMQEALNSRKQELEIAQLNKTRLESILGITTKPHAIVESAKQNLLDKNRLTQAELNLKQADDEIAQIKAQPLAAQDLTRLKALEQQRAEALGTISKLKKPEPLTFEEKLKDEALWTRVGKTKGVWLEKSLDGILIPNGAEALVGRTKLSKIVEGFIEKLGLGDHKLVVGENLFRVDASQGSTKIVGDTTYISLNRETIQKTFKDLIEQYPSVRELYDRIPVKDQIQFRLSLVLSHELGHAFWYRAAHSYFRSPLEFQQLGKQYIKWIEEQKAAGKTDYREASKSFPEHYLFDDTFTKGPLAFKEFLAQVVSRKLLADVGEMSILAKFIRGFRELVQDLLGRYKGKSENILGRSGSDVDTVIGDLFDKIIRENKTASQMGETIFTNMERTRTTFGAGKTLQDTATALREAAEWGKAPDDMPSWQPHREVVPPKTFEEALAKTTKDIGSWSSTTIFNFFGKMQTASRYGIYANSPMLHYVYTSIRQGEELATKMVNTVWHGSANIITRKNYGPLINLQKIENGDSPSFLVQRASDSDMFTMHTLFEQGYRLELDYAETLAKYGRGLTQNQRDLFESLARMFKSQWEESVKIQMGLGKKHILPYRKGWYPAVRLGDWYIELKFNGVTVHRQHFRTQDEAKIFTRRFESLKDKQGLESSIPLEKAPNTSWDTASSLVEIIQKELNAKGFEDARETVESLLERMITKGGTLGQHHKQRSGISGYRGSELFKSEEELGRSFRAALHNSVDEYASTLRKMIINQKMAGLEGLDPKIREQFSNTFDAVDVLTNTALNKNQVLTAGMDELVRKVFDKSAMRAGQAIGIRDYYPPISTFDRLHGVFTNLFYIFSLTLRPSFWFGNVMTSPTAIRALLREDNSLSAMASFASGTMRIMHPDDEFKKAVHFIAQYTNTFHPQFVNDLTKNPLLNVSNSEYLKKTTEFFTGQSISSVSDSFSRYWTFSMFYEHYKKKGLTGKELWMRAAEGTDSTMGLYSRADKAPIFEKLGIIGEALSPLQTYGQMSIGNLISDFKYAKTHKNIAPLVSTFLTTGLLAGAVGVPLLLEYEALRLLLEKLGLVEEDEYSIMKALLSGDNRILSHGVFSETGYDIGSGLRAHPIVRAIVDGQATALDMFPAISWAVKTSGAAAVKVKHALGADVSIADQRAADFQLTPGIYRGLLDDIKYDAADREFVPSLGKGYATVPQTDQERTATYLGTRTIPTAIASSRQKFVKGKQEQRSAGVNETTELLGEAVMTNNTEEMNRLIHDLITKHHVDPRSIPSIIQDQVYRRSVPAEQREQFGKKGPTTLPAYWKYQQYQDLKNPQGANE